MFSDELLDPVRKGKKFPNTQKQKSNSNKLKVAINSYFSLINILIGVPDKFQ